MEELTSLFFNYWYVSYLLTTISTVIVLSSIISDDDGGCLICFWNFFCIVLCTITWILWISFTHHHTHSNILIGLHTAIIYPMVVASEALIMSWINGKMNLSVRVYKFFRLLITLVAFAVLVLSFMCMPEVNKGLSAGESVKYAMEHVEMVNY